VAATALVASALLVGAPSPARADTDPYWYTDLQVGPAHQAGADGRGVTLAILDASIRSDVSGIPALANAHLTVSEQSFCAAPNGKFYAATTPDLTFASWHGTNVTALAAQVAPAADILFYSMGDPAEDVREGICAGSALAKALMAAVDQGARVVSISQVTSSDTALAEAVAFALHEDVIIVAGVGDVPSDSDWLSGLNGVVAVQATGPDGQPMGTGTPEGVVPHAKVSVTAPGVDITVHGDLGTHDWTQTSVRLGTSLATPLVSAMLVDLLSAQPGASGAQALQALVRTAGGGGRVLDPVVGYGQTDLGRLLSLDATTLPGTNPLVLPDDGLPGGLTEQDIRDAKRPVWAGPAPRPTSTATASPSSASAAPAADDPAGTDDDAAGGVPVWVWAGAGTLAVGLVTTVGLLVRRRTQTTPGGAPRAEGLPGPVPEARQQPSPAAGQAQPPGGA
jgi:hypothetical protein